MTIQSRSPRIALISRGASRQFVTANPVPGFLGERERDRNGCVPPPGRQLGFEKAVGIFVGFEEGRDRLAQPSVVGAHLIQVSRALIFALLERSSEKVIF